MANTLKFGNGQWATGNGTALAYNDENANFKPLPFDFTRASSGTTVNQSGLIETVGSGLPRIDFLGNTKGALKLETSRTNIILQSQDITTGWSQGNAPTLTSNIAVAPDGTMTADGIQSETDGAYRTIRQLSISVSANSTITNSYFVKKETSEINYGGFGFVFSGGTNKVVYGIVNSVNGTVTYDTTLTPTTKVENYGSYWKISTTVTDTGSNTSLGIYYYGTLSINGTSLSAGVGSVRTIWGMQLELGSYPTSYIPTFGSAVTRVVDACSNGANEQVINSTEGVFYFEGSALADDGTNRFLSLNDGTTNNYIYFRYVSTSNQYLFRTQVGGVTINTLSGFLSDTTQNHKFAFKFKSGDYAMWVDGVEISTDVSSTIFPSNTLSVLEYSFPTDGGDGFPSNTKDLRVYNTALTDAELKALTTI